MTTNMRNAVEQAAYEAGRAQAKYEMLIESDAHTTAAAIAGNLISESARAKTHTKAASSPPKAPTARKAAKARTKGVKEAVINLIASEALAVPDIVSRLGFKEGSVRAVLMDLKKSGRTVQDETKRWAMMPGSYRVDSGNSEIEATAS